MVGGARVPEYRRQPSADESANTSVAPTAPTGVLSAGVSPNDVASAAIAQQLAMQPKQQHPKLEDLIHQPKANPSTYHPAPDPKEHIPRPNPRTNFPSGSIQQPRGNNY